MGSAASGAVQLYQQDLAESVGRHGGMLAILHAGDGAARLGAIAAFTAEMLMASIGIRTEVAERRRIAAADDPAAAVAPRGAPSPPADGGTAG